MAPVSFTILGEPASKANSREIVTRKYTDKVTGDKKSRPMSIKSDKALHYEAEAILQIPPRARLMLQGPVAVTLHIFYASERPDLDESVILDVLQARYQKVTDRHGVEKKVLVRSGVYINDRQVREKHVFHGIDRKNPRAEITVVSIAPQAGLDLDDAPAALVSREVPEVAF